MGTLDARDDDLVPEVPETPDEVKPPLLAVELEVKIARALAVTRTQWETVPVRSGAPKPQLEFQIVLLVNHGKHQVTKVPDAAGQAADDQAIADQEAAFDRGEQLPFQDSGGVRERLYRRRKRGLTGEIPTNT